AEFEIRFFTSVPFPEALKNQIRAALTGTTEQVCALNYDLGRWYAEAVKTVLADNNPGPIDLIGSHGQTIHHISGHSTLQVGEPSFLAQATGIPVVSDFRAADVAAGGTGAPLIPRIDEWLFRVPGSAHIALNIGGVANVTLLPQSGTGTVSGFDTGPGMALLDETWRREFGAGFDASGELAATGEVNEKLVREWLEDDFIPARPPKSTGRDKYGPTWLEQHQGELAQLPVADRLATLAAFTADSIYVNCRLFLAEYPVDCLIVGGGGVHHGPLQVRLATRFAPAVVVTSADFGVDPDAKEALGFALLAAAFVKGIPGNLPAVTGAARPVILGKLSV
ncbi:MAG: anhydro-N-acetylmuramic acid kinase, partial [Candidatus Neomarinimicrobiota bacterium]